MIQSIGVSSMIRVSKRRKRTWCIVSYPSWLRIFDAVINMTHFMVPFAINLISAAVIIWKSARQRTNVRRNFDFKQLLGEQFRHHKHLLITPLLIIVLGLPCMIISIVSDCMKSSRNAWLYFLGYLISFICPMLSFVLPSKLHKEEFNASMRPYRRNFLFLHRLFSTHLGHSRVRVCPKVMFKTEYTTPSAFHVECLCIMLLCVALCLLSFLSYLTVEENEIG